MDEMSKVGVPRLHLAGPETMHMAHVLKVLDRGFFSGMSTQKKLLVRDFAAPALPDKEWKSEWAVNPNERQPAPTTVRPVSGTTSPKK